MFPSKYPIVLAGMNPVSDTKLAAACYRAGMTPTLCGFIYYNQQGLQHELFAQDLGQYISDTGSNNIIPSLDGNDMLNSRTVEILKHHRIKHVELIENVNLETWPRINAVCVAHDICPIIKILHHSDIFPGMSIVMLKGPEGAGRGNFENICLSDLFDQVKQNHPSIKIIVSGGIATGKNLEYYLDKGADAVAVGTLFAASKESCISLNAKQKIIQASRRDITKIGDAAQNALVFSELQYDDYNNTRSNRLGIATGDRGHIFVGSAVDHVNNIEPVSVILSKLLKGTRYEKNVSSDNDFAIPSHWSCLGT